MKKWKLIIISCLLLAFVTGCDMQEESGNTEDVATEQVTNEQQPEENQPVLSEESQACIEKALNSDDDKKYAEYIAKYLYLSGIPVDEIIRANVVGNQDENDRIYIEVEDSQKRIYVVVVSEGYDLVGIKENSTDGKWIFTVTQDMTE